MDLTVCSYHVKCAFQSECTLNVKELPAWNRHVICSLCDCNGTRTHNHLVRKQTLNHLAKLAYLAKCLSVHLTEDLILFNQLSSVLNVYTKYLELSESFLVKSGIGIAVNDCNIICPFHRAKFGKECGSSRLCIYPDHQSKFNSALRALTKDKYNTLPTQYSNKAFPFGALICINHVEILAKPIIHSHSAPMNDPDTAN